MKVEYSESGMFSLEAEDGRDELFLAQFLTRIPCEMHSVFSELISVDLDSMYVHGPNCDEYRDETIEECNKGEEDNPLFHGVTKLTFNPSLQCYVGGRTRKDAAAYIDELLNIKK